MKKIGITQRVEVFSAYKERRDCLDQRWSEVAFEMNFIPIPLPNIAPYLVSNILNELQIDAIILSGGNTITSINPSAPDVAPERDAFEKALINEGLQRHLPILGVCRGMQVINMYFGGALSSVEGHVFVNHEVVFDIAYQEFKTDYVNSFHNWTVSPLQLGKNLKPIVFDRQGNIEAFIHHENPIAGILWHPERIKPFRREDINLLKKLLS